MSRRTVAKKRPVAPDPVYQSRLVSLLVSHLLKKGKKSIAYNIFYAAMKNIAETTSQDPLEVLRQAVLNITPKVEVKSRRVGGATLQVPLEVKADRGTALALRWLLIAARNRSGRNMVSKLSAEIIDASNNTGAAIRRREETHRMAEANKAFAHFRF
ncbi:ribosomal protein S7 (chloroplast) [Ostreococcus tauri]|jgi:small subunit ribosomal protein S7|uniref:Small ribosomal subunit protein uS7c n=2 Tax=Ostreococcus tauri TaxID=70448 RepID=RR7_OSTTA|nr:ribosomal protein S7 [Ostreococcus tauri]Q0P3M8.1 RecName: Full=Small ribosomal subunit protein uS7c; AltName: Full=30S ribosomal protein S7, chloroplastic [Ostreococcus tauri]AGR88198.1 ribosomal protein S7 [Ostreococcus tauri]AGW30500.1 ribosomal protein S7 [Ostreococcus tauri]AGW30561.1 ribosomal protein S7 [Ostreococcus tauri]AGW30622.1 ribosomal protein S7 [Ostreococcus tauri]AGW30683.1 ribosomal protein S7 [Ostreococcus tauri]|eukprot:YP_717227.1 Rps7 (chloroplast) [Ostreococcus tauri]